MVNKKNLSFHASLEGANSFKEFFFLDALIPLDWKVDFTLLGQPFCCGASSVCSLPKLGDVIRSDLSNDLERSQIAINFATQYFHHVSTRDDMLQLKNQRPDLYDFYHTFSKDMYLSRLNNANVVRQHELIINHFDFKGIDDVFLSSHYVRNAEIAEKVRNAVIILNNHSPIHTMTIGVVDDPEVKVILAELKRCAEIAGINVIMMTEDEINAEEATAEQENGFEYWEEHTIWMVQNKFFLNKHDSLHQTKAFYEVNGSIDPWEFVRSMVSAKVETYRSNTLFMDDCLQLEYYKWVANHVTVNDDFTFLPGFMTEKNQYWDNIGGIKTPAGILKSPEKIVPLFEVNDA